MPNNKQSPASWVHVSEVMHLQRGDRIERPSTSSGPSEHLGPAQHCKPKTSSLLPAHHTNSPYSADTRATVWRSGGPAGTCTQHVFILSFPKDGPATTHHLPLFPQGTPTLFLLAASFQTPPASLTPPTSARTHPSTSLAPLGSSL